ncbi:hypothetical protein FBEOM_2728 [Fusarium beomiforme]|uniref:Uncharacterized protein n=1 Tax=Fusarium beomiforme TaxID=44412 RepID=A0A9P5ARE1_9HYPO|nr:hypothetical protein FBEOM_2728 [Fusarium beomiforme]
MNWTEGALARHSRRKGWDKDATRQKQYFAKARARKNDPAASRGHDISSFVPDYIPRRSPSQSRQSTSSTPRRQQRAQKQKLIYRSSDTENSHKKSHGRERDSRHEKKAPDAENSSTIYPEKEKQELDITAKRRRLLEKADWTGVITQKPVTVDFSRQRELSTQSLAKSSSRRDHRSLCGPDQMGQHKKRRLGRLSDNEIQISIGNQNLRWSKDSNSVRSFATRRDSLPRHENSMSDNATSITPASPYQQAPNLHYQRGKSKSVRETHRSRVHDQAGNMFLSLSSTAHPESRDAGQEEWVVRRDGEPRYVVQTHAPVIHQPQPTRETRHQMIEIQSSDLDEGASAVAVLGVPRHSHRITAEDIRWNMWLDSRSKSRNQQATQQSQDRMVSRPISPCISNYVNTSDDTLLTPSPIHRANEEQNSLHVNEEPQSGSSGTYPSSISASESHHEPLDDELELPELQTRGRFSSIPPATSSCALPKSASYERSELSRRTGSDLVLPMGSCMPVTPNVQDLLDLLAASEEQHGVNIDVQTTQDTPNAEDEDDIWKKFVLDDDTAETSRKAREEAYEQTKCAMGLKKQDVPQMFSEPSLPSGSTEPPSDIAEPPSVSRGEALPRIERNLKLANDQIQDLSGADSIILLSEAAVITDITDATESIIAQPASPQPFQAEFKFHQPQLFVGRLASDVPSNKSPVYFEAPPKKGRRQLSRRRRDKGRPDFRAMPNYDDDPIEED